MNVDPIISADGHVSESPDMWERIPEQFRSVAMTRVKRRDDGFITLTLMGNDIVVPPPAVEMDDELRSKEFRNDPTGGRDLSVRTQKQLLDGVHAEVVFPNTLLCLGNRPEVDLNLAVSRAYNDWVYEVFAPEPERYIAAAFVPVDDIAVAVHEAERCIREGFPHAHGAVLLSMASVRPARIHTAVVADRRGRHRAELSRVHRQRLLRHRLRIGRRHERGGVRHAPRIGGRDAGPNGAAVDHRHRYGGGHGADRAPHRRRRARTPSETQVRRHRSRGRLAGRGRSMRWTRCSIGAGSD